VRGKTSPRQLMVMVLRSKKASGPRSFKSGTAAGRKKEAGREGLLGGKSDSDAHDQLSGRASATGETGEGKEIGPPDYSGKQ